MSVSYFPFAPNVNRNFQFAPTLDGTQYTVLVNWSLFGRRWLVNVYNLQGVRVVTKPLRTSPDDYDINMLKGYFTTSSLVYRASSDTFEVRP